MVLYNKSKPAANDELDVSQVDIQQNFEGANNSMFINHYTFDDATVNNGKHKFVEMPVGVLPLGLSASEATVYSKTANAESQLFFTPDLSANEYQLTRSIVGDFATFSQNPGWTFLPGGLLMQWGTSTTASGSTITFPVAFTNPVYNIQCTISQNTTNRHFVYVKSSTTTNFVTVQLDSGGSGEINTFSWLAIGK